MLSAGRAPARQRAALAPCSRAPAGGGGAGELGVTAPTLPPPTPGGESRPLGRETEG